LLFSLKDKADFHRPPAAVKLFGVLKTLPVFDVNGVIGDLSDFKPLVGVLLKDIL